MCSSCGSSVVDVMVLVEHRQHDGISCPLHLITSPSLLMPVPIYWRQIRLVFASITSKPRAQHKKKHILHVCVLAGLIPCVFRLLPVVSDCFHSQQNASAVCLEQEKDPHVLTWPNKPDSKRKAPQECEAVSFRWYYSDGVDCRCIKPGSGPALTSPVRW